MNQRFFWCAMVLTLAASSAVAERLPRFVLPQHYALSVVPDLAAERFSGDVAIDVLVQMPVNEIVLNSAEIAFRDASIVSAGETQTAAIALDPARERVTLTVPRPLAVGPATIRIRYEGVLNRQLRGFYIGASDGRKYLASQMQATDARRAFPSFDEPDLKATFRIEVVTDASHKVISNAPIASETAAPDGRKTVRFAVTPRLSTYHVALVVGDFDCLTGTADGVASRVCALSGRQNLGRFALQATDDVLRELNRYFEIPYPFAKLDQIALADFSAGAMENPGAVTYRDRILLADERSTAAESLRASTSTIAHELAHMWFGDLVTMRWWDDIWLNEGFATWMARRTLARVRPQWVPETADAATAGGPMNTDVLLATRPIRKSAETPAEIGQLFDGIAYGKTAALLRMLETYAGEEKFREGVNLYMRRHAFSNASASEFAAAIESAAGGAVAEILSSYVNQPGVPLVTVRSRCETGETVVTLQQRRFLTGGRRTPGIDAQIWTIPVCFGAGDCVLLREREQTFRLAGCRDALAANAGGVGYYLTAYETADEQRLVRQLSPPERLAFLRDGWFRVLAGERPLAEHLDLAVAHARDLHVAESVLTQLRSAERYMATEAERPRLQAAMRRVAEPLLRDLGWTSRADDTPELRELRREALTFLGERADHPPTIDQARRLAARWLRDRSAISPDLTTEVLRVAATRGDARLYDSYLRAYRGATDPREQARFLSLLTSFRDPALLRRTLQWSLTDEVRTQDIAAVLNGVLANPAGTEIGWSFLLENWDALEKKIPSGHVGRVIGGVTMAGCDGVWTDRIRRFATDHPLPHAARAVSVSLERIEQCAALRLAQQQSLAEWVARQ